MKLVELFAKELSEWPDKYCFLTQSAIDCSVYGGFDLESQENVEAFDPNLELGERHTQKEMYPSVTKAQWQAERDRQKGGEWKRHRGGNQPVAYETVVEWRMRDGETGSCIAGELMWDHQKDGSDIMSYRIISQPQAEEVEVNDIYAVDNTDYGIPEVTFGETKTDQIDGPIKWRDTVNELDAYIEEFTREREALINRLAEEGFALLPAMTPVMGVADVVMHEKDWEIGDIVEVVSTYGFSGERAKVGDQMPIIDRDDDNREVKVATGTWGTGLNYRFIRRP